MTPARTTASRTRLAWAITLVLIVAACGFRPLYSDNIGGASGGDLGAIKVQTIPDRVGQLLHNHLLDRLNPQGRPSNPKFVLETRLYQSEIKSAIQRDDTATRVNLRFDSIFRLVDESNGQLVFSSSSRIFSTYNILQSQYATLASRHDAERRAVRELADDMKLKLAAFLRGR